MTERDLASSFEIRKNRETMRRGGIPMIFPFPDPPAPLLPSL